MGTCATSAAMSEEQIRSQNIDAEMNRAEKDENEKIKLLLLGDFSCREFLLYSSNRNLKLF